MKDTKNEIVLAPVEEKEKGKTRMDSTIGTSLPYVSYPASIGGDVLLVGKLKEMLKPNLGSFIPQATRVG